MGLYSARSVLLQFFETLVQPDSNPRFKVLDVKRQCRIDGKGLGKIDLPDGLVGYLLDGFYESPPGTRRNV